MTLRKKATPVAHWFVAQGYGDFARGSIMTTDPQVALIFSHNLPRYIALGVDPNDGQRLIARIERWEDWCKLWSEEAARHEALAKEATEKGRAVTAAEAY